jgi:hypothetical protein
VFIGDNSEVFRDCSDDTLNITAVISEEFVNGVYGDSDTVVDNEVMVSMKVGSDLYNALKKEFNK